MFEYDDKKEAMHYNANFLTPALNCVEYERRVFENARTFLSWLTICLMNPPASASLFVRAVALVS